MGWETAGSGPGGGGVGTGGVGGRVGGSGDGGGVGAAGDGGFVGSAPEMLLPVLSGERVLAGCERKPHLGGF